MTDSSKVEESTEKLPPNAGKGRPKGVPNKLTTEVKQMILDALEGAGGVDYLIRQAEEKPVAFLALVGKVLPLQVTGAGENGEHLIARIERVIVDPANTDA
jgi:hypothetical protein